MKPWPVVISIVVILAIVCSPALAISKADLIASYKGQSSPTILTPLYPAPSSPTGFIWAYTKGSLPTNEPTPTQDMSDEEWNELTAKYSSAIA
jgi:hypothetical protein